MSRVLEKKEKKKERKSLISKERQYLEETEKGARTLFIRVKLEGVTTVVNCVHFIVYTRQKNQNHFSSSQKIICSPFSASISTTCCLF